MSPSFENDCTDSPKPTSSIGLRSSLAKGLLEMPEGLRIEFMVFGVGVCETWYLVGEPIDPFGYQE